MPGWVTNVSKTVYAGQQYAVLNAEDLANGSRSEAIFVPISSGGPVPLTIINHAGQSVALVVAANNTDPNAWAGWFNSSGVLTSPGEGQAWAASVTGGLFYAIQAEADITAGTVILAR